MYKNNSNLRESLTVFPIRGFCTNFGGKPNNDMTVLPCTGLWDNMCLYMKLYITVIEVVSHMDTFTDTLSLLFQTRLPIQIRILEVIP